MRTARVAFLQNPLHAEFSKLVETTAMDSGCEHALLVYAEELPSGLDPNAAWTAHAKLVGAREVLAVLRTIHLKQETPTPYRPPQLRPPK